MKKRFCLIITFEADFADVADEFINSNDTNYTLGERIINSLSDHGYDIIHEHTCISYKDKFGKAVFLGVGNNER